MKKVMLTLLAAAILVGLALPALAAVENVKVGGDVNFKMIYRNNFDFMTDDAVKLNPHYTYMGTRIYVKAELSGNVEAMVRLINERDFGNDYLREVEGSVLLDLGYVKVSDLLTKGLTLTVGRQEIQLGEGLVVGSRYRALDYLGADVGTAALDYGQQKAFDAVKVDFAPAENLVLSAFKAKIIESYGLGTVTIPAIPPLIPTPVTLSMGDVDLWGASLNWKPEGLSVEPYFVSLNAYHNDTTLMTGGVRATWDVAGFSLKGEFAKQFGEFGPATDFKGWAGYLGAGYTFDVAAKPAVSFATNYFSGDDGTSTDIKSWIPVFPANIASRVGKIAYPALFPAGEGTIISTTLGLQTTGLWSTKLGLGLQPTEKLGLGLDFFYLRANEVAPGISKTIGYEIDASAKYMITEDLSLCGDLGYFMRGGLIKDTLGAGTKNAWQAIASIGLAF